MSTVVHSGQPEDFADRMRDILNSGMIALMVSVGHRTGLFDVLARMPSSTCVEIATAAGLSERYVREWLGAMVTGRIVDHDPVASTFTLAPRRAAFLTRAAGPANLAVQAQYVGLLARVEDEIVDCFRNGGGVPYEAFPGFHALMAEDSGAVFDATLLQVTLPLVPGLSQRLDDGIDVADVGCGSGHAINVMAQAYPRSRFTGFDVSEEAIAAAIAEADRLRVSNAHFECRDAADLTLLDRFDLITTFDVVHDQADPGRVLAGIADALRPGGAYLCVDVAASSVLAENLDHPFGPMMYTVSCMHCMTVSLAAGGAGLGAMWGEGQARAMLAEAGFTSVEVRRVDGDELNCYFIATVA